MIYIRQETPADFAAIETVIRAAFKNAEYSNHTEQFIVKALRQAGQLSVALVAEQQGAIIGHIAISPVSISSGAKGWYGLGPIAVLPDYQCQGIGTQLMEQALAALREIGAAGCVLLGEPSYYARFCFKAEPSLVLPEVPAEYFQAILFNGALPEGEVSYHAAFAAQA